jgi:hypothetical protein
MIVAEVIILSNAGLMGNVGNHQIRFDSLEAAMSEYERIVGLLKRQHDLANDLPKTIEVIGTGSRVSLPLEVVHSVALSDFALMNEQQKGLHDAFPILFK